MSGKRPSALNITASKPAAAVAKINVNKDSVRARIQTGDTVEVLLYGATITSWKSDRGTKENLWLSQGAKLDGSKPVRGGVPLAFPIFGPPPAGKGEHGKLSQHGFARTSTWEFLGSNNSEASDSGVSVSLVFGLSNSALDAAARAIWTQEFGLTYTVILSENGLQTTMSVQNPGSNALDFNLLFHTYFKVPDVNTARVVGLGAAKYFDRLTDTSPTQTSHDLTVAGAIDRVYSTVDPAGAVSIVDAKSGCPLYDIARYNLPNVVVWNPWKEGAAALSDFLPKGDDEGGYVNMLCVEAGNVSEWNKLEPGEEWEASQTITSR